jgi:uncharacterized protein
MHLFIIPLSIIILTQGLKIVVRLLKGDFSWNIINSYGGMPSSHAALAASLSYTLYHFEGISSPAFAVSVILFVIMIRDAMGYRYQLGIHGRILNRLIKELPARREYRFPVLSQRLGHTPYEVLAGVIFGVVGSVAVINFVF